MAIDRNLKLSRAEIWALINTPIKAEPIFADLRPKAYPHFDERGCYRYRPPTFFECLTPRGRLQVLRNRARKAR